MHAYIVNDVPAWEVLYNHPDEQWGVAEIQEMLLAVGFDPGPIDGELGPSTEQAMRDFLGVSKAAPVCNDAGFRAQLFRSYMSGDGELDIPAGRFAEAAFMGCGEYNPVTDTPDALEANRRVSFFLFHEDRIPRLPCRFGELGPCARQSDPAQPRYRPTFRCSFYDSMACACRGRSRPPTPLPTIHFVEVAPALQGATDVDDVEVWGGSNFSPPLGHHVHFRVRVRDIPPGFKGTAQLEIDPEGPRAGFPPRLPGRQHVRLRYAALWRFLATSKRSGEPLRVERSIRSHPKKPSRSKHRTYVNQTPLYTIYY